MQTSHKMLWTGKIMSGLASLFMLFDVTIHILGLPVVQDAFIQLGYAPSVAFPLGILGLACVVLYLIPRTSILGAILLTGYLGGAVATHVRVGDPLLSHVLFPAYIGILFWGGLYFRNEKLRELIPFRKS